LATISKGQRLAQHHFQQETEKRKEGLKEP
jgi:hypothetical protein